MGKYTTWKPKTTRFRYKKQGRRTRADKVLAQGVGKVPTKAFGNGGKKSRGDAKLDLKCWDAFHPYHLPLPRSVGPYTVVRTTTNFSSDSKVVIIAPMRYQHGMSAAQHADDAWSTACVLESVNPILSIDASNNARLRALPFPGANRSAPGFLNTSTITAVPSAISVQVMNPNPLQTTQGMVFGSVSTTQLDLRNRADTWDDFADEFISFMKPRMMSAGKLALRGVQGDSFPLNMNSVSDFSNLVYATDMEMTYNDANAYVPDGWSPIVIINKGAGSSVPTLLNLNYLVTIEWRVRFDISNPAVSSHTNHGITSDNTWDQLIRSATARASGMIDIAERVANIGRAAGMLGGA